MALLGLGELGWPIPKGLLGPFKPYSLRPGYPLQWLNEVNLAAAKAWAQVRP